MKFGYDDYNSALAAVPAFLMWMVPARGLVRIVADLGDDPWGRLAGVLEAVVEEDTGKVSLKVTWQRTHVRF